MLKIALVALALATVPFAMTPAAEAKNIKEAMDQCRNTPGCTMDDPKENGGSTMINGPKGGMVYCPEQGECIVVAHA